MSLKKKAGHLLLLIILAMLSACASNVAFSKSLIEEYGLETEHIKYLQFYLGSPMILEREIEDSDKILTDNHSLKQIDDKYIEQIKFKMKTPCLVQKVIDDVLYVTFEKDIYVKFKVNTVGNRYTVDYDSHKSPNKINSDNGHTVYLNGGNTHKKGYIMYQDNNYDLYFRKDVPYLLVNEKKLRDVKTESRTVGGMKH